MALLTRHLHTWPATLRSGVATIRLLHDVVILLRHCWHTSQGYKQQVKLPLTHEQMENPFHKRALCDLNDGRTRCLLLVEVVVGRYGVQSRQY